jgi:hypothetical protein
MIRRLETVSTSAFQFVLPTGHHVLHLAEIAGRYLPIRRDAVERFVEVHFGIFGRPVFQFRSRLQHLSRKFCKAAVIRSDAVHFGHDFVPPAIGRPGRPPAKTETKSCSPLIKNDLILASDLPLKKFAVPQCCLDLRNWRPPPQSKIRMIHCYAPNFRD